MDEHKGFGGWISNGGKYTIVVVTIILLAVLGLYLQIHIATQPDDETALSIESVTVPETVEEGGDFIFSNVLCNELDGDLGVTISVAFESEPPVRTVPYQGTFQRPVAPGCKPGPERVLTLPEGVTPGKWRLDMSAFSATAAAGGFTLVTKQSELFEVTEGR